MNNEASPSDFESAKVRLEEIADAVGDESLSLDDALDLFEEAVSLGLRVSDYVEEGIVVETDSQTADESAHATEDERGQEG